MTTSFRPSTELFASLVFSTKCNSNCDFCYERHTNDIMSDETIKKTVEFFYEKKPTMVTFWLFGGEPTIVPEKTIYAISLIIENYKKTKIETRIQLFSNAIIWDQEIVDNLLQAKEIGIPITVQVSFDGNCNHQRDNNNLVTRENIKKNLLKYVSSGLFTAVRSTLSPDNFIGAKEMYESFVWIVESGVVSYSIMPVIECDWDEVSIKKWDDLFSMITEYMKEHHFTTAIFNNYDLKHKFIKQAPGCEAGHTFFSVDSNGEVSACHKGAQYSSMSSDKYNVGSVFTDIEKLVEKPELSECSLCRVNDCAQCTITNDFLLGDPEKIPNTGYCKVKNVIWDHYLEFYKFLEDNHLTLQFDDDQKALYTALLLIGDILSLNDLYLMTQSFSEFEMLIYRMCNEIVNKLAEKLDIKEMLPLQLEKDYEKDLSTILLFIETNLVKKYNEKFNTTLGIGDYVFTQRLINILQIMEIMYA